MTAEQTAIENPRLWRMALQISSKTLNVVLTSMVSDSSLRQYSIALDQSQTYLKALEEAIYSMPSLLADYGRVDILVRTEAYTIVPAAFDDDSAIECGRYAQLPNQDKDVEFFIDRTEAAAIVWTLDADVANFLARTFRNAPVQSHMAPLMRYTLRQTRLGNTAKLFAHFTDGKADIITYDAEGALTAAVTHTIESDTDALYFIMALAREGGLDVIDDEILLCGEPSRRTSVMNLVSRYAARVMPMIFPSAALRAGREAFKAPFPLIIMPLCE